MTNPQQPPLFPDPRREELYAKQVAKGVPADTARSYADRFVFPDTGSEPAQKGARERRKMVPKVTAESSDGFPELTPMSEEQAAEVYIPGPSSKGLTPVHYPNRDFFLCDLFDYAMKDDGVTMEAPIFSLATKKDTSIWEWKSKDALRQVTVTPSVIGRATQHDKDVLIYMVSHITEGLNRGRADAQQRTVRFTVHDYLVATNKSSDGGKEYKRLEEALDRLQGTKIKTNIKTGGERVKDSFSIIGDWRIIEKSPTDDRMIGVEVEISRWLFNAVQAREVLTISADYFRLRKPTARRLYELARKHCGAKASFTIGIELLMHKCGSKGGLPEFRRMLKEIIESDVLPDYRLSYDKGKEQVTMHNRNVKTLENQTAEAG